MRRTELERSDVTDCGRLERIVRKRFGLALVLSLSGWWLLGFFPQFESFFVNGLLLDGYWQLAFLTMTNVVAFFFSFSILRLLNTRIAGGWFCHWIAGDGSTPWSRVRIGSLLSTALITPMVLAFGFGSEFPPGGHWWRALLTIAASAVTATVGLFILGWCKTHLVGSDERTANFFPFEAWTSRGLLPWDGKSQRLDALQRLGIDFVDFQLFIYLILLGLVHGGLIRFFEGRDYWLTSAPSMLVLLIWLIFMSLAGMANILDRWRVPALPVVLPIMAVLVGMSGATRSLKTFNDHSANGFVSRVAELRKQEDEMLDQGVTAEERRVRLADCSQPLENDAWRAISNRMQRLGPSRNGKGKTLVVVTCPGGGIHAAAWAACVLDQLAKEYEEFKDSLCVISGVSGGSVGTLMFVSSRYHDGLVSEQAAMKSASHNELIHRELREKSPALELAARSSLEAVAFGISVDDLYGLIGIPGSDRGQRLEDSFQSRLPDEHLNLTMGDWGDRALDGTAPVVIFNSTDAVTGRRILFDSIPTPRRASSVGLKARPLNYRELLNVDRGPLDLRAVTAVRASATFPYLSPFTKPENASPVGEAVALCDGGYVDNEGVVTAVNWIEFLAKRWERETGNPRPFDRILLLRIQPSSDVDQNQVPDSGGLAGWFRWLTGPVETMAKVRAASQTERGNLESDLAARSSKLDESDPLSSRPGSLRTGVESGSAAMQASRNQTLPEFDPRKQRPDQMRQNWEKMLTAYEHGDVRHPLKAPQPQAVLVTRNDNDGKLQVIAETVAFVDANQVIPLNWKLSNRQKQGYLLSWQICARTGTSLRATLDRYFTRSDQQP